MKATTSAFAGAGALREAGAAVLYGAGRTGREVCDVLCTAGIRVICMLDRTATGTDAYRGVPVLPLEACPVDAASRDKIPAVVSIFNRDVDVRGVATTLRAAGFAHVISFVDLHAEFAERLGDRFWLTDRRILAAERQDIARAESLWADEESVALYRAIVDFRRTGCYGHRLQPRGAQYFAPDIPGWLDGTPVRFVDCGAYRGDTLDDMVALKLPLQASAHFEPDPENFTHLVARVRVRLAGTAVAALAWPCAVSSRSAPVSFENGMGEASRISRDGGGSVMGVALDDVLLGWKPTFIKMDIEGAEIDALNGGRRVIAENRPRLAVCVYHRPDHLWRIPLLLSGWPALDGYRYYLRSHGYDGFDTVLYASPRKEVRCD